MKRRHLLKLLGATTTLTVAGRLYAAPQADMRLLVIFLRGAYDAANVVVPISSDFYYRSRPTLAIARPNPADANAALPLDGDWGLHPALKDTLYPLFKQKQLAYVPFAGTDDVSRSHFETQDTIELGQSINGSRNYRSGFMGRLAEQLANSSRWRLRISCRWFSTAATHPYPIWRLISWASPISTIAKSN